MENNTKRFLSLLLAMVMVLGMFPMGHVHAEGEETVLTLGEKVTVVAADTTYVICLAGTKNALTNQKGSTAWGTNTLATVACGDVANEQNIWTLESAEGGYKLSNANGYATVERNKAELNETGHVFELVYTGDAGWTIKSLDSNEYFNNLGDSGSIGGWSGDGTKFDIYSIVESSVEEVDPWGKRNWVKVSVDTETVYNANEGKFEYAWDNNPNSIWHSNWQGATDKLTGENTFSGVIDFGKAYNINQFSFTPRVGNTSGQITMASLYVKENEADQWKLVAEHAAFAADGSKKNFCFEEQAVQYVKFVAESSSDGWVAVSEFDIDCTDHTITEAVTEPTCGAAGYTTYTCSCGNSFTVTGAPATGEHSWDEGVYTDPTTEADGCTTYTCTVCEATKKVIDEGTQLVSAFNYEKLTGVTGEASSEEDDDGGESKPASNAFDGNVDTFWASEPNANGIDGNEYLIANLNGKYLVGKVVYTTRPVGNAVGSLKNYTIWVSTDGVNYESKATGTVVEDPTSITITFDEPVEATHIKLTATESRHWNNDLLNTVMSAAEFEVYKAVCTTHTPGEAATCGAAQTCTVCGEVLAPATGEHTYQNACDTGCDVCGATREVGDHVYTNEYDATCNECGAEREVKAFNSEQLTGLTGSANGYDEGESAVVANAFDGNTDTYWCTPAGGNVADCYLIANLNGEYLINKVEYTKRYHSTVNYNCTGNLLNYTIWVSNDDGATWQEVASGSTATEGGVTVIEFAPVRASMVKLTATESYHHAAPNTVMTAAEFAVFKAVCEEHTYGEGVVTAEPTCTEAGVKTFTCSVCGHTCTEVIPATGAHTPGEPVREKDQGATYEEVVYCSVCNTELSRKTVNLLEGKVVVSTMNVRLEAEIKMVYSVKIPETLTGAKIVLTKAGGYGTVTKVYEGEALAACMNAETGCYEVEMGVASGEMTAPITIEVYANDTAQELFNNSAVKLGTSVSKTVVEYAETILKTSNDEKQKNLVEAMLVYGGYAQAFFDVDAENPAYGELDTTLPVNIAELVADYQNTQSNPDLGVKATSINAVLDSAIYLRVYLAVEGDISQYSFTLTTPAGEQKEVEAVCENGRYYVDITDIASGYIDFVYTITVTKGEQTNEITTSVLSYVRSVLNNDRNTEAKKNLAKALYLYNQAADEYWPNR